MYAEEAAKSAQPRSLMERGDTLTGRLREVNNRLIRIADTLFGSVPQAVGNGEKSAGAPVNQSIQRHIDLAHTAASEIEAVLVRIESCI